MRIFTKHVLMTLAAGFTILGGVRTRQVVHVGDTTVALARAPGDALADATETTLALGPDEAFAGNNCSIDDVKKWCCGPVCPAWSQSASKGRDMLQACMKQKGCSNADGAAVSTYCDCK
jgi:hypothetical protein